MTASGVGMIVPSRGGGERARHAQV